MSSLRERIPGLASGFAAVFLTIAAQARPEKPLSVSQWTEKYRVVSEDSQSPAAGKWENSRTPYLIEPMDACQLDNGVRRAPRPVSPGQGQRNTGPARRARARGRLAVRPRVGKGRTAAVGVAGLIAYTLFSRKG